MKRKWIIVPFTTLFWVLFSFGQSASGTKASSFPTGVSKEPGCLSHFLGLPAALSPFSQLSLLRLIAPDPSTDLALIQIKASDLPALQFVNSDQVKVGEWVLAVGNPFNLNSTVTA